MLHHGTEHYNNVAEHGLCSGALEVSMLTGSKRKMGRFRAKVLATMRMIFPNARP